MKPLLKVEFFFRDKSINCNSSQLYYTHPWLPTHIRIDLTNSGNVEISKLTDTDLEKAHSVSLTAIARSRAIFVSPPIFPFSGS